MVTLCWAVKGGSGTTVIVAALALESTRPSLVVDLAGDVPVVLGAAEPDRPGVTDWLAATGSPSQLDDLLVEIDDTTTLLPAHASPADARFDAPLVDVGRPPSALDSLRDPGSLDVPGEFDVSGSLDLAGLADVHAEATIRRSAHRATPATAPAAAAATAATAAARSPASAPAPQSERRAPLQPARCRTSRDDPQPHDQRWEALGTWLREWEELHDGTAWIDAGTGTPPLALASVVEQRLLVTRACYLSINRATNSAPQPSGVLLIDEPGRQLRTADIERSVGAPIIARIDLDPSVARAVDCGLLASRPPRSLRRSLRALSA